MTSACVQERPCRTAVEPRGFESMSFPPCLSPRRKQGPGRGATGKPPRTGAGDAGAAARARPPEKRGDSGAAGRRGFSTMIRTYPNRSINPGCGMCPPASGSIRDNHRSAAPPIGGKRVTDLCAPVSDMDPFDVHEYAFFTKAHLQILGKSARLVAGVFAAIAKENPYRLPRSTSGRRFRQSQPPLMRGSLASAST